MTTPTTTRATTGQLLGQAAVARTGLTGLSGSSGLSGLSGLDGSSVVSTATFKKTQVLLARTVRLNDIAAVSGPPGCGKTYAVEQFVHRHKSMAERDWHWLEMPPKPTTKEVTQRLMRGLNVAFSRSATEYDLTEDLVPHLAGSGRVIVIDESQNLKSDGLQQLRYLHDRCSWSWSLLLVGSTVDRALSGAAELSSRVSAWVRFAPLSDAALLTALREWHPALRVMPPELLLRVDDVHGRGNWRQWAQFLRAYLDLLDRHTSSFAGNSPGATDTVSGPGQAGSATIDPQMQPTLVSAALAAVSRPL